MDKKKIIKVLEPVVRLENVHSVGVIGDPGCEGLGTYNMKVYAGALEESGKDDITLIVGDLVPAGTGHYYRVIQGLTDCYSWISAPLGGQRPPQLKPPQAAHG